MDTDPAVCKLHCSIECPVKTVRGRADCFACKAAKERIAHLENEVRELKAQNYLLAKRAKEAEEDVHARTF